MSGPAGLEERPADSRTLAEMHFRFSYCLKHSAHQVPP